MGTRTRELPALSANTVIAAPSLIVDVNGKMWFVDPRFNEISEVSAVVEDEDDEIGDVMEASEEAEAAAQAAG